MKINESSVSRLSILRTCGMTRGRLRPPHAFFYLWPSIFLHFWASYGRQSPQKNQQRERARIESCRGHVGKWGRRCHTFSYLILSLSAQVARAQVPFSNDLQQQLHAVELVGPCSWLFRSFSARTKEGWMWHFCDIWPSLSSIRYHLNFII